MPRSAPEAKVASLALQPGQRLFNEGEAGSTLYVIQTGQVELLKRQGHADVRVSVLGGGELVGEAQALAAGPRTFSAQAVEASQVLVLEADALMALLGAHPDVALAMLRRLAPRLEAALVALLPAATVAVALPAAARLVHSESGREFALPDLEEVRLGRADARSQSLPDVDLSSVDPTRSLSRRHARIVREAGAYQVFEEPRVTNGTFLNRARLVAGQRAPLRSGDELRLGAVGLVFQGA